MQRSRDSWLTLIPAIVALVPFLPMLVRRDIPVLRDHADYFIPLRWFTAQQLRLGHVPHWNSLNGIGEPWLANPQTGVVYPPSWLMVVLPFETGYVLWLALHLAILACGVAAVARRYASPASAVLTGSVAAFTGPVLSMIDVSNNLGTLAWLPWIVYAGLSDQPPMRRSLTGGGLLALAFLAGEPALAAAGALVWVTISFATAPPRRALEQTIVAGLASIILAAPQLIPFVLSLGRSDRTAGLDSSAFEQSLSIADLSRVLIDAPAEIGAQQFLISLLLGPTLIILMSAGLHAGWRRHRSVTLATAGLATLLVLLAFAGSSGLGAAMLASAGFDAVRHPVRFIAPAMVLLLPFAAAGLETIPRSRGWMIGAGIIVTTSTVLALSTATPAATLVVLGGDVIALLAIVGFKRDVKVIASAGAILIAVLLSAGAFAFRSAPLSTLIPPAPDAEPGSRIAVQSSHEVGDDQGGRPPVAGYSNLLIGVAKADSPAPVVPVEVLRFVQFGVERANPVILSAASVSRLFSRDDLPLDPADSSGWWKIEPLPLISGWSGIIRVSDDEAALRAFLTGDGSRVYGTVHFPAGKVERAPVRASLAPLPNGWNISSESDRDIVLLISERSAPGWRAWIDGNEVPWFTVNGLMRGIAIPAGTHRIEWRYLTPGWREGWAIFAIGALLLAIVWRRSSPSAAPKG